MSLKKTIPILILASFSFISHAQDKTKVIADGFKQLAPSTTLSSIKSTPISGVSELKLESAHINDVYYITDDGKYLINGDIIEMASRNNLTENSKSGTRKEIIDQFDDKSRMNFYPKDMKHRVTVYTDIDCGYCRKLHGQMQEYNDLGIGISYLFYPRSGIGSTSYNKAVTAWCSVDQNEAMTKSQMGEHLEPQQCDNPVKEHYASGQKIGVSGTPNIVTDYGLLWATYMSPNDLLNRLEMMPK